MYISHKVYPNLKDLNNCCLYLLSYPSIRTATDQKTSDHNTKNDSICRIDIYFTKMKSNRSTISVSCVSVYFQLAHFGDADGKII